MARRRKTAPPGQPRKERIDLDDHDPARAKIGELFKFLNDRLPNNTIEPRTRLELLGKLYALTYEIQTQTRRLQTTIEMEIYDLGYISEPYLDLHLSPIPGDYNE